MSVDDKLPEFVDATPRQAEEAKEMMVKLCRVFEDAGIEPPTAYVIITNFAAVLGQGCGRTLKQHVDYAQITYENAVEAADKGKAKAN